jgi:hypothetical protein
MMISGQRSAIQGMKRPHTAGILYSWPCDQAATALLHGIMAYMNDKCSPVIDFGQDEGDAGDEEWAEGIPSVTVQGFNGSGFRG